MKTYICTKIINAVPVKMVNGCPWPEGLPLPEFRTGKQIDEQCGCTVEAHIEDGYMYTTSADDMYPQFMSTADFEALCRSTENMNFGDALAALKQGKRVARSGWNGKNMSVAYQKGYPEGIPCNKNTADAVGIPEGSLFKVRPYLQMKCVDGSFQM